MTRRENTLRNTGALILFLVDFKREQNEKEIEKPFEMYKNFILHYMDHPDKFGDIPMIIVFKKSLDIFTDYGALQIG